MPQYVKILCIFADWPQHVLFPGYFPWLFSIGSNRMCIFLDCPQFLSDCYPDCSQHPVLFSFTVSNMACIFSDCYPNMAYIFSDCYPNMVCIFSDCYPNITWISPDCSQYLSDCYPDCSRHPVLFHFCVFKMLDIFLDCFQHNVNFSWLSPISSRLSPIYSNCSPHYVYFSLTVSNMQCIFTDPNILLTALDILCYFHWLFLKCWIFSLTVIPHGEDFPWLSLISFWLLSWLLSTSITVSNMLSIFPDCHPTCRIAFSLTGCLVVRPDNWAWFMHSKGGASVDKGPLSAQGVSIATSFYCNNLQK